METEKEIIRDMWLFLKVHRDPPASGTAGAVAFWDGALGDLCHIVTGKWHDHQLAVEMAKAIYAYMEHRSEGGAK